MKQQGVAEGAPPATASPPPSVGRRRRLAAAQQHAQRAGEWARANVPYADVLAEALERERIAAAGLLAGGLAYRLFFWIVPLGLVMAAVLSFWVEDDRRGMEDAARTLGIGGASAKAAADAIEGGAHSRWYFLLLGIALLVWFGSGVVRALSVAHCVAWRLRPQKVEHALRGGVVFTAIVVALIVTSSGTAALREELPGPGLGVTLALVALYLMVAVWAGSVLPSRASGWRPFLPGAVYLAVGSQFLHLLVALYLAPKLGRSSELYGALGAATVILLWLYLEARLLVGAAFLNAALFDRAQRAAALRDSP
jgi:membrane protein